MRRFTISRFISKDNLPEQFQDEFLDICTQSTVDLPTMKACSANQTLNEIPCLAPLDKDLKWDNQSGISTYSSYKVRHFDADDMQLLLGIYRIMYPRTNLSVRNLSETIHKFGSILIGSICYGSRLEPRRCRSSYILASWPRGNGEINTETFSLSAGSVFFYFSHSIKVAEKYQTHYFACVRWYKPAALELREFSGKPTDVWKCQFQDGGTSSIIPIQRIYSRFACAKIKSDSKTIPIERPIFFLFLQKH